MPTDPRGAWFAWRTRHLEAEPLEAYEWGVKIGQRVAIERTAQWAGLVPLLQDVLDYLIESAIERDMAGASLTGVDGNGEADALPASAGPDPTVGRPSQQLAF